MRSRGAEEGRNSVTVRPLGAMLGGLQPGLGQSFGRWWVVASPEERTPAAHKRLVPAAIGSLSLSANGLAFANIGGHYRLRRRAGELQIAAAAAFFIGGKIALRWGI
jgi:hypothetical protein